MFSTATQAARRAFNATRSGGMRGGARHMMGASGSTARSNFYKRGAAVAGSVVVGRNVMGGRRSGLDKVVGIPRGMRNY